MKKNYVFWKFCFFTKNKRFFCLFLQKKNFFHFFFEKSFFTMEKNDVFWKQSIPTYNKREILFKTLLTLDSSSSSSSSSVAKWHIYHSSIKNFILYTHHNMFVNKFQTWKNPTHQHVYHILWTESSANPIYKGPWFDSYLTRGLCSTARLVFWLGSGRIQSTCIDSSVCWFCYPCVNRVARHISTLL